MIIYQIEFTNHCNSACQWCNHASMRRPKGFMNREVFEKCVDILKYNYPPGGVVGLHHFGESLLHPNIKEYLEVLKRNNIRWRLSTNGRLLSRPEIRELLLEFDGLLVISLENGVDLNSVNSLIREKQQEGSKLQLLLQTFGDTDLKKITPGDFNIARIDKHSWAKNGNGDYRRCCFLLKGWNCILWDGTIITCCMDLEGDSKVGSIFDYEKRSKNKVWQACKTCEVVIPCR